MAYNTTFPQTNTAYGTVPGQIGIPPSAYDQVSSIYPNMGGQVGQMSGNIGSELAGQLSPDTIAALQQHAAQFGTQWGMPGSQFAGNAGLRSLGLNVEATKRQGGQDLLAAQTSLAGTQTPQSLAADIASRNATMAAAPNPQAAATQQMNDWMAKFNASMGPGRGGGAPGGGGGSPSGGTGVYDPLNYQAGGAGGATNDFGVTSSTPFNGGNYVQTGADFNSLFGDLNQTNQPTGSPLYWSGSNPTASSTPQNQYGDPTGNAWAQQQDPFAYAQDTGNYNYSPAG